MSLHHLYLSTTKSKISTFPVKELVPLKICYFCYNDSLGFSMSSQDGKSLPRDSTVKPGLLQNYIDWAWWWSTPVLPALRSAS